MALELAVARGTFLLHRTGVGEDGTTSKDQVYFLNNDAGRTALSRWRRDGSLMPSDGRSTDQSIVEEPPEGKTQHFRSV